MADRVRFITTKIGSLQDFFNEHPGFHDKVHTALEMLADILWEMELAGVAPILADGRVGGNAAMRIPDADKEVMIVTKSGKRAGKHLDIEKDICIVVACDLDAWAVEYYAASDSILPTCDSPMHYAAFSAYRKYGWSSRPDVILHGHALQTEEAARQYDLPISTRETAASTPEDTAALMELFGTYAYPESKVFIRKGHGFVILAGDVEEGMAIFRNVVKPAVK